MAKTAKKAQAKKVVRSHKMLNRTELNALDALRESVVDLNVAMRQLLTVANKPAGAPVGSFFETPPMSVSVPPVHLHTDVRGFIRNITHKPVGSVALIESKANTTRAKHWHREDAHLCYVISGKVQYFERPVGSGITPDRYDFMPGDAFYTGPHTEHEMFFPEDTLFLTLGNRSREQADYEKDLVRLPESLRDLYIRATGQA